MRPAQLERGEVEIELWLQFLAIPRITAKKLLVVGALFIPSCQKRTGEIKPLPIPALRHHVDLPANLLLVNLFRFLWVRNIENSTLAVAETIYEQGLVVGANANIDGKNTALRITDRRDLFCLPVAVFVLVNEPQLRSKRGGGEGVVVLAAPGPADFERHTRHLENFFWLTGMKIPHHHGIAEVFHRFGIGGEFAEVHHVVVPTGERRGQQRVLARQHTRVVAVAIGKLRVRGAARILLCRQPMGGDVIAVVPIFDQGGPATVILRIGKTRNEHTPGQCIRAMWPGGATRGLGEVVDRFHQFRLRRIAMHVEDEHATAFEAGEPELTTVIGKAAVVRLVPSIDRRAINDLAVGGRARLYIDGDKFVRAIAQTFDAERPNIDKLFLSLDAGEVRRRAGFIGPGSARVEGESEGERKRRSEDATRNERSVWLSDNECFHI